VEFLQSVWHWYWDQKAQIHIFSNNDLFQGLSLVWDYCAQSDLFRGALLALAIGLLAYQVNKVTSAWEEKGRVAARRIVAESTKGRPDVDSQPSVNNSFTNPNKGSAGSEKPDLSTGAEELSASVPPSPVQPDFSKPLSVRLVKDTLEDNDRTQSELADAMDVSRAYISKIFAGAKPFTPELQEKCRRVFWEWKIPLD